MKTIKAKVSQDILANSHLLFNQNIGTILNELLQNGRRAGANQIEIRACEEKGETQIQILDNGNGVKDSQDLLFLGKKTSWSETTQEQETPAGMGMFSLCHLTKGVEVHSKNWKVRLNQDAFQGKAEVKEISAPFLGGTEVTFKINENVKNILQMIRTRGQYFPVPIRLNGVDIPQEGFLKNCKEIKKIPGASLGIELTRCEGVNFFGIVIMENHMIGGETKRLTPPEFPYVRVDVQSNKILDLVLPARNEIIKNEKWVALQTECRRFVYETLEKSKVSHNLSYKYWLEAKNMGITLREAEPVLFALNQEACHTTYGICPFSNLDDNQCKINVVKNKNVATCDLSEIDILAIHLSREEGANVPIPLQSSSTFEGYSWYPKTKITSVLFKASLGGKTFQWKPSTEKLPTEFNIYKKSTWPLSIQTVIEVTDVSLGVKPKEGKYRKTQISTEVPVGFAECDCSETALENAWIPKAGIKEKDIGFGIDDLLYSLFFSDNQEGEADSFETQKDDFYESCGKILQEIFQGKKAKNLSILKNLLEKYDAQIAVKELKAEKITVSFKDGYVDQIKVTPKKRPKKP